MTFGNANGLAVGHGRLSMAAPDGLHGCRAMTCGRAQSGNRDNAAIRPEARQHEKPAVSSQDEARQATKQGRGSSLDTHNGCSKISRNSHSLCGGYFRRYAGQLQPPPQNSTGRSCLHNCAL
ncbi:hypothetical protein APV28_4297 [Comamonas testosteroni]|nr:hypothetical protein APV28_4297 [Comamonas testosteroni]